LSRYGWKYISLNKYEIEMWPPSSLSLLMQ
jgi:hypothetical protein